MQRTRGNAAWRGQPLTGVFFDLDGTLLDTAADIAGALNRALGERGWDALPLDVVSRIIGRGSHVLIERAAAILGHPLSGADRDALLARFFHHYELMEHSDEARAYAYPGALETLQTIHDAGMRVAVVTNKLQRFASALLGRLAMRPWIDLIVGGDTCGRRKPDPLPLLFACESLALSPSQALMVGDSINDVGAARAAGMAIVCVPYGYNEGRDPGSLECDVMIDSLAELPALLWA